MSAAEDLIASLLRENEQLRRCVAELTGTPSAPSLAFALDGRPVSWARKGPSGSRRFVTTSDQRNAKERYHYAARAALGRRVWDRTGEYEVEVLAYYPDRRLGDVDRISGLILDAMEGVAYEKDRQASDLIVRRRVDRERPRVEVRVVEVDEVSPRVVSRATSSRGADPESR